MRFLEPVIYTLGVYLLSLFARVSPAYACSAFCLQGQERVIVGKSYDWYFGHGFGAVYTNPRGIARTTMQFDQSPNPAHWVSKFGSVTLTQFGRGAPISGMNEKGLVVELLQLEVAQYNSDRTDLPYVNESQWSQFQLDNFASVQDVIDHIDDLRVERAYTGIHYFLADPTGQSAVVEFLDGEVIVHTGINLPIPILTNDPYRDLLQYSREHPEPPPESMFARLSEVRFQRAKLLLDKVSVTPDHELPRLAWDILETVRLNGFARDALMEPSQWNIVYDLEHRQLFFKSLSSPTIKAIDFRKVNFSEGAMELMLDMNLPVQGDLTPYFHPYSFEENSKLINKNALLFNLSGQSRKMKTAIEYGKNCNLFLTNGK